MNSLDAIGSKNCIILAGVDGSGKTSLSRELLKHGYAATSFGKTPLSDDIFSNYMHHIKRLMEGKERSIMDRSFLCEIAYGTSVRDQSRISLDQARELAKEFKGYCTVVYLYASVPVIAKRILELKPEDLVLIEKIPLIGVRYEWLLHELSNEIPVIKANTEKNSPAAIISHVLKGTPLLS